MITLHELTIKKTHSLLLNKEISAFDLTKEFLIILRQEIKKLTPIVCF